MMQQEFLQLPFIGTQPSLGLMQCQTLEKIVEETLADVCV